MAISDKNERTMVIMPKELKEELKQMAEEQSRSLSNLILNVLKDYVQNK